MGDVKVDAKVVPALPSMMAAVEEPPSSAVDVRIAPTTTNKAAVWTTTVAARIKVKAGEDGEVLDGVSEDSGGGPQEEQR